MTETIILVCKAFNLLFGIAWILAALIGMSCYQYDGRIPRVIVSIFSACLWAAIFLTIIRLLAKASI